MIEKKYSFTIQDKKTVERIIADDNVDINHIILLKGDSLPEHFSNSNVYLIIIRGEMSIKLNDQDEQLYEKQSIINVPYKVKMSIKNKGDEILEFFVLKAPSPRTMGKEMK